MWQDTINKRLIVLNEPYLDLETIEKAKEILEGTGCFVSVKSKPDQFLEPTPVIVTSNTWMWSMNPAAERPLKARCISGYMELRSAPFLEQIKKELHPLWLDLALKRLGIGANDDELNKSFEESSIADARH